MGLSSSFAYGGNEFDKKVISHIEIKGNVEASSKSVRKLMATRRSSWYRKRRFSQEVLERDLQAIMMSYHNNGYLSASIDDRKLEIDPANTTLKITIWLKEGPRFEVRRVAFDGNAKLSENLLSQHLLLREGRPFRRLHLDDDLARLQILYAEHGMVDARIEQHLTYDHAAAKVDIAYPISEGETVHIGLVGIEGNRRVKRRVIERELTFSPNARYNHLETIQSQANLFRTGFFSQVSISLVSTPPGAPVRDVLVKVEERKTGEVNFGVGYGTFDRARLSLEGVQKCFRGTGLGVGFEGKVGRYERTARASMTTQWVLGRRLDMDGYGFYGYEERPAYTTEEFGTQLDLRRRLALRTSMTAGGSVKRTILLEGDIPRKKGRTNALRVEFVRDTRNDILSPSQGSLQRIQIQWAGGPLGADHAFVKVQTNASGFLRLPRGWVVGASLRWGWLTPLRGGEIPVYERFFAGGAKSVRGYSTGAIGVYPKTPGGKVLASAQNEVRFPLWPKKRLGGTLLVDVGQTWLRSEDMTPESLKVGVGGGFRMGLPFGLVRFDLALPTDKPTARKRLRYYAGIGQAF